MPARGGGGQDVGLPLLLEGRAGGSAALPKRKGIRQGLGLKAKEGSR